MQVDGVELDGLSPTALSALRLEKIGFVFQAYNLLPVLTAQENVEFILQLQSVDKQQRRERAAQALDNLGLGELGERRPGELSGGQQQRVAIARAIVTRPVLLVADEPTANLDSATTEELLVLMARLNSEQGMTIVTATHDPMVMSTPSAKCIYQTDALTAMAKAYGITPRHIMGFAPDVSLLCATAQADDYVVVVGSYANDNNAQQAQIRVANYLRQSGMAAQAQIIESAGRLRVAVVGLWNNPAKACYGVYAKDRT